MKRHHISTISSRKQAACSNPTSCRRWRLLPAASQPYTRERFEDTYNWTVKWNMVVTGATYEKTVDSRAREKRDTLIEEHRCSPRNPKSPFPPFSR